ncbi:MAG: EAL domain-containing protein [Campylobacterales bacterium]
MNLKIKSLLAIIFMTIIISLIIGYISVKNSDEILKNNLKKEVELDSKKIVSHLEDIEKKISKTATTISQNRDIIATLNLISNYQDRRNYQAIVFDAEKEALLEKLKRYFLADSFYEVRLYDNEKNLIVTKKYNPSLGRSGFVTYKDNKVYLKNEDGSFKLENTPKMNGDCKGGVSRKYEDGYYKICDNRSIMFEDSSIGALQVVYYLGQEELKRLEKNLTHPFSLIQLDGVDTEFNTTLLDENFNLFLKHQIDLSYTEQKRQEMVIAIILTVTLISFLQFLLFFAFIRKEVLAPLKKLQNSLESALKGEYKPIEINNNDEIGKIFRSTNKIFEKFWQSHASLQGYKESVETSNLVTKTDLKGNITYANELFCTTSGYKKEEVIGKPHNIVRHPDMPKKVFEDMWSTIKKGSTWRGVIKNRTSDGGFYFADSVITPICDMDKNIKGYISIRRDITELMKKKEELEFRANYDMLTSLKNRDKLHVDIKDHTTPALIFINIDRFSQVNDFYGHSFGDRLLVEFSKIVSEKLLSEFDEDNFALYRYGGDEFAILFQNYHQENLVDKISQIILELERKPIVIEDKQINLNLSCGVSFEESQRALLSADMALKLSKEEKKNLVVYSEQNSLNKIYENNLLWAGKLKKAIEESRIVPFFQPIVNNSNLANEKYEALVRIIGEDGKVISPFFFLDIAKQTKQYLQLTQIMIEKSFEVFKDRSEEFSINLTMEDISNLKMKKFLFEKLDRHLDVAKRVVLELVESESIADYNEVIEFINVAKSKGCKIAIDDFGSGYSNFEYLIKLQADYIKIDGSLIKHINTQRESFVVVSTIVSFAKQMGIKTIAEFIEDENILRTVQELGIDYSQGYYFSPPKQNI